jgi:mannose-6-phosphate isomerase
LPERFPILFKIIDAQDDLSLQVHPGDEYAALHEKTDPGKTEMWYVFHAQDCARIYCGLKKKTDLKTFKKALKSNQPVTEHLQIYSPQAGDAYFIPAGTVHALGKGNVVIEVQQNSDITYRLNDWGRMDDDGKPRPLHIEKGIQVTAVDSNSGAPLYQQKGAKKQSLVECPYFNVFETISNESSIEKIDPQTCQVWTILEGKGKLEGEAYHKGDFILIPAHIGEVAIQPSSRTRMLITFPLL